MRYLKECPDPAAILAKANGHTVRVLQTPTIVRTTSGPYQALRLQYWVDVPDEGGGTTWTYSEIVLADGSGGVDLSRTVLAKLRANHGDVVYSHRSGSLS